MMKDVAQELDDMVGGLSTCVILLSLDPLYIFESALLVRADIII